MVHKLQELDITSFIHVAPNGGPRAINSPRTRNDMILIIYSTLHIQTKESVFSTDIYVRKRIYRKSIDRDRFVAIKNILKKIIK